MGIPYCSRDDVTGALDVAESARNFAQIDRLIEAASRGIETLCRRRFYPTYATRYLDWPDRGQGTYRLYLDETRELISLTSITSGGVALTEYFLEPQADGPPYTRLEIDLGGSDAFTVNSGSGQRSIALTGVFGGCADLEPATTLVDGIIDNSGTTITVADGLLSPGHLVKVDNEYLQIVGRQSASSGATISANLTAQKNATAVTVSSAASFTVGEVVTVDTERMLITDITGTVLVVERGWSGSTLAAHTSGATVYAGRALTVLRGQCGTTATTHPPGSTVHLHVVPPLVRQLAIAETLNGLASETSGYARTIGAGEAVRNASMTGIKGLRNQVTVAHARVGNRKSAI